MTAMRTGKAPGGDGDADRAVDYVRQVLESPQVSAEITAVAEMTLTFAEVMQTIMGGFGQGPGGFDIGRMTQAMAAVQKIQQDQSAGWKMGSGSLPPMPSLFDAETLAALDPLDRPIAVVNDPMPDIPPRQDTRRTEAAPTDPDELRTVLLETLTKGKSVFPTVESLLTQDTALPATETIDDIVALAALIAGTEEPTGTDHLLLAVALYLRSCVDDGGGWGDEEPVSDVHAAAESLQLAIRALPVEQADVLPVVYRLATLLDLRLSSGDLRTKLTQRLDRVAAALREAGADALAYPQHNGVLSLSGTDGHLALVGSGESWPPRVLVVGEEPLPLNGSVVSSVASAAQVVALARRTRLKPTDDPVFVANPRGDQEQATFDALLLRRTFYPRSTGLGRIVEDIDGAGTPDDVLAHLSASMLHLGCGVNSSGELELAGAELSPQAVAARGGADRGAGGVAILPPIASKGFPGSRMRCSPLDSPA